MIEKQTIVLVDDDEDDRHIFKEGFIKAGCTFNFLEFESGKLLLDYLKQLSNDEFPALILLDLNMPVTNGREILNIIKTTPDWLHIPVVVFTTSTQEKDRKICYEMGANCFISKPGGYQEILNITHSIALLWCLQNK